MLIASASNNLSGVFGVPADGIFTAHSHNGDRGRSRSKGSCQAEYNVCLALAISVGLIP